MGRKNAVTREFLEALQAMKPRQALYEAIKNEMKRRGRWRVKPRGKPFERGNDPRRPRN